MKSNPAIILIGLCVLATSDLRVDAAVGLENDHYSIRVEASDGSFTLASKPGGRTFLTAGKLSGTNGTAKSVAVTDKVLGDGQGIEISYPNGNREVVAVFPGLPFVTFRSTLHNGGTEPVLLNHLPTVSGVVNLGVPLAAVRTLGTGGLLEPAQNPGSYAFLAIVDPATRGGVVGGWLTHDRGSGVVFSPVEGREVRMQAQIDYGRLRIKPGENAAAEMFAIGYFEDARIGLEAYADAIAKVYSIKLPPHTPGYCTWYMEKFNGACDEVHLAELSEYAAKNLKPFGFDFILIDDGWQEGIKTNGPKKNFTAYATGGPYPGGMKATADNITRLGSTPGIWFMPFAGTHSDPFFKDHQDWFVKTTNGAPFDARWGGTSLDMTQPGAREHLRGIVRQIARDWGYRLFKMDGFWTGSATRLTYVNNGYVDDEMGDAIFSNPDKTNIEALRDGAKLVRAEAGRNIFLLGCVISQNMRSFGGSLGLVDAMRVGPDTGSDRIGSPHASRLWFLNGRVWWNDPDCVSVRGSTPLERARMNATFTVIADNLFYNSDWMPDFSPERLDVLRRCIPAHGLKSRPVDVFESPVARIWHLEDTRSAQRRDVVALYNWGNDPAHISCPAARIGLPEAKEYVAFDFWANTFVPPFRDAITGDIPRGSCRVLAIRPVTDRPQLLSTSRHITQGIVDVTDETWSPATARLSAASKVVENDPYELRIVVPQGADSWRADNVFVSGADRAAGVKTEVKQDGPRVRVAIASPTSREVRWSVQFVRVRVEDSAPKPVANLKASVEYERISLSWEGTGADQYRVRRDDGAVFVTPVAAFDDRTFSRGKPIRYAVESVGWSESSAPVAIEATPIAGLVVPAPPRLPTIYVDELKLDLAKNGRGEPRINLNHQGKPLSVSNRQYAKGLGLRAPALVICPVPPGATRFVAVVGVDDSFREDGRSRMKFVVEGDVKEMGEAPVVLGQSPELSTETVLEWSFDIELNERYKEVRLVVDECGDRVADFADWLNAGFVVPPKGNSD